MLSRMLFPVAFSDEWGRQMRFITGPRQSGKTTLARQKLNAVGNSQLYYLWDLRSVRNRFKENELFFTQDSPPTAQKQWVCFDEIHKFPLWKNALKAVFDSTQDRYAFIVTGSAKLDIFRKAGDSLSGRYFTFHLFPLSLAELMQSHALHANPPATGKDWIEEKVASNPASKEALHHLLQYGGFPEPFLRHSEKFYAKWAQDYADTVIKEDIGALTRILDKEHLYDLLALLPQMVGSPLSESSVASHLELSNPTIKNYLRRLEDFYLAFKLHPYSKNIKRALIKTPKCYLMNWANIKDPGKRFENYVAVELTARLHLWTEMSADKFELFYIRNRQKEETDFLILKNRSPWLLLEAKLTDGAAAGHHYKTQAMLGGIPFVQLCQDDGVCKMQSANAYRISAGRFLS